MKIEIPMAGVSAVHQILPSQVFDPTISSRSFHPIVWRKKPIVPSLPSTGKLPPSNYQLSRSHEGLRKTSAIDGLRLVSLSEGFQAAVSSGLKRKGGNGASGCPRPMVTAVFERFTERAIKAIMLAQREAKALGKREVGPEQLLLGLIAEERGGDGFLSSGVTIARAREAVKEISVESAGGLVISDKPASEVPFAHGSKRVFEAALDSSRKMGHNYITPEHIAIALFTVGDNEASRVLERLGLKKDKLHAEAVSRLLGELAKDGRSTAPSAPVPALAVASTAPASQHISRKDKGSLEDFCLDLTAQAAEGKIDPVIGRDEEVQRVLQILARRTKNNPILLGEPGVGKTAISEGLAIRIANGTVPEFLVGKRVMSLDMGLLLSGAKERGELEKRMTSLLNEARSAGNVILMIDEVHTLVGSGSAARGGNNGAGLDIANLLKPALAKGDFQCIGATTLDEHRKHIEKDKALARRFQPVFVKEPSQEDAVKILLGLRGKYEEHHKCKITDDAVDSAVYLSARYIADRRLPDKAIDLLDEAGSRARIDAFKRWKEGQVGILSKPPSEYWQEIRTVQASQEAALISQTTVGRVDYASDARFTDPSMSNNLQNEDTLYQEASPSPNSFSSDDFHDGPIVVGPDEIAAVAAMWSGIPLQQLTADEQKKLLELEQLLQTRVVGQEDAVSAISRAVRRARVGLKDPNRPIAALLFCGPTGVGKTELTKALAEHYFGSEGAMIRLDMSEYMERHTVSKLVGSPPGYVGYAEAGTLTEAVRRRPFTVVLLDEIEKAHPDVFNLLLQIFEDGRLTDSQGRVVSFKNTLLIMTSNIGSSAIARGRSSLIGFTFSNDEDGGRYASLKSTVMEELKGYFRPELLNRLDEVVVFRSLEKSQIRQILDIMLEETKDRLNKVGVNLEVSEKMIQLICDQGYDRSYGARPLRRTLTRLVEDILSDALLSGEYEDGDTALVDVDQTGDPYVTRYTKPDLREHGIRLDILKPAVFLAN